MGEFNRRVVITLIVFAIMLVNSQTGGGKVLKVYSWQRELMPPLLQYVLANVLQRISDPLSEFVPALCACLDRVVVAANLVQLFTCCPPISLLSAFPLII